LPVHRKTAVSERVHTIKREDEVGRSTVTAALVTCILLKYLKSGTGYKQGCNRSMSQVLPPPVLHLPNHPMEHTLLTCDGDPALL
jgi:hypothetical protein